MDISTLLKEKLDYTHTIVTRSQMEGSGLGGGGEREREGGEEMRGEREGGEERRGEER